MKGTSIESKSDVAGKYQIMVDNQHDLLTVSAIGYINQEVVVGSRNVIDFYMMKNNKIVEDAEIQPAVEHMDMKTMGERAKVRTSQAYLNGSVMAPNNYSSNWESHLQHNTEEYSTIHENIFHDPTRNPLSTFSIDVDAASYSNIRRFLRQGQKPPKDAVRIEEMINYFTYQYPEPEDEVPFSVYTEVGTAPWNQQHQLVHIGLQGKHIPTDNLPSSNLVFLVDVSGSMNSPNKLGLLKSAFKLLTDQLRATDKVSIVVYAGAAGVCFTRHSRGSKTVNY